MGRSHETRHLHRFALQPMSSPLVSLLATVIAIYGLLTVFIYLYQDNLLFFPSSSDPDIESHYKEHAVSFAVGDVALRGWFLPASDDSKPTLVFYGGNGQELSTSIASITSLGDYNYVLVNYRGYGRSTGHPSEEDLKSDALFILDSLETQNTISLTNTIIMGRSLGSGIAMHVAANRQTRGLILISPFNSIEAIASDIYFYLPVGWLIRHPFRSIDYVAEVLTPTLIIKAEHDRVIPESYTNDLIEAWHGPLKTIKLAGTNHNYIETESYFEVIDQFLQELD